MLSDDGCHQESEEKKTLEQDQNVEQSDEKDAKSADETMKTDVKEESIEFNPGECEKTPLDDSFIATSDINDSVFSPVWTSTLTVSSCSLHDESSVFNTAFLTPSTKARLSRLNPNRERVAGASCTLIFGDDEEEEEQHTVDV